jgi:hypothetical protein
LQIGRTREKGRRPKCPVPSQRDHVGIAGQPFLITYAISNTNRGVSKLVCPVCVGRTSTHHTRHDAALTLFARRRPQAFCWRVLLGPRLGVKFPALHMDELMETRHVFGLTGPPAAPASSFARARSTPPAPASHNWGHAGSRPVTSGAPSADS